MQGKGINLTLNPTCFSSSPGEARSMRMLHFCHGVDAAFPKEQPWSCKSSVSHVWPLCDGLTPLQSQKHPNLLHQPCCLSLSCSVRSANPAG